MKEHVFVKNICGVPYDVFDPGGKSTKLSIRDKNWLLTTYYVINKINSTQKISGLRLNWCFFG